MWNANCGFLPVEASDGKVIGMITTATFASRWERGIGLPGDVTVSEVMPGKLYSCAPDDDIHMALQTMKEEGKVSPTAGDSEKRSSGWRGFDGRHIVARRTRAPDGKRTGNCPLMGL